VRGLYGPDKLGTDHGGMNNNLKNQATAHIADGAGAARLQRERERFPQDATAGRMSVFNIQRRDLKEIRLDR